MQFAPAEILRPYVKNYTLISIDKDLTDEVFYPSGYVDLVINISEGSAFTLINGRSRKLPGVEVLGHLTLPSRLTVTKGTSVLIARIYPFASSLFFTDSMSEFTNYATDAYGIFLKEINDFYAGLMETATLEQKVAALEGFLIAKLGQHEKQFKKVSLIRNVCNHIFSMGDAYDSKTLSSGYGLSERYMEKLFMNMVGISPRALFTVHRFNKSLNLVLTSGHPLTSIAYECGYHDQSHFIKEFSKFTGTTPLAARSLLQSNGEEFQQVVNIGF
ncbi:transcriptional regulator [Niastella yeongjuensis]|uniref:Transcriptional regulator n=1 Tax=Niastella yeongjuensis TaxID=354355 RepID=A0A1V9EFE3_9BACT|nr:helix-turn-helix domain-containing protein [Niastella yeongjuensis]OQP44836.1 transcriptional regulator [Niastella yeongjuensis]SEP42064.1 Helix-turn-helix domain-containing protein [Niastella yeongjuensis]